jgi:phospholipid/cholesterol/gamma-HCH transport system permease protein
MVVSQQIDAMRALGTSPVRKLVTPRLIALLISLPLLTVVADILGILGGGIVATGVFGLDSDTYFTSVRAGVGVRDLIGGAIKPIFFALIIGIVSCHKGLSTTGGTVGVGRATTSAVVISSIAIIIADFFLSKLLQTFLGISSF